MTDERIVELFGYVPYFADTAIEPLSRESGKSRFQTMFSWCCEGSVNIQRICGTMHPDYAGLTWRQLLTKGRRMENNLNLYRKNPDYYTSLEYRRLPSMRFSFYDGKGYVAEDGNHRTCIARFFLYGRASPFLHGVYVSEVQTDMRLLSLFERLSAMLPGHCAAEPVSREISRDDGDGWATHFYENTVRVTNRRGRGCQGEFSADELELGLIPALCNPFRRKFGHYRNLLN